MRLMWLMASLTVNIPNLIPVAKEGVVKNYANLKFW